MRNYFKNFTLREQLRREQARLKKTDPPDEKKAEMTFGDFMGALGCLVMCLVLIVVALAVRSCVGFVMTIPPDSLTK
jgi:hypothetical protein